MAAENWSYSKLSDYEACAYFYKGKHIDRIPAPRVPAMDRGIVFHKQAEVAVVTGNVAEELSTFRDAFKRLNLIGAEGSQDKLKLAFSTKWKRVPWDEGWAKMIPDTVAFEIPNATVIEYKTGKEYDPHVEQTQLYAIGVLAAASKVNKVDREVWYFDQNYIQPHPTLERGAELQLREEWSERASKMFAEKRFEPTPSWRCKRCYLNVDNGGTCTAGAQI